jgi:RND family efflux transporter MFP subunit
MSHRSTTRARLPRARFAFAIASVVLASSSASGQTLLSFTEPYETVLVAAPEAGIIDSVAVEEGDRVVQDQVIASLDDRVLQASLAAAEAKARTQGELAAAQAAHEIRRRRVEKFRSLQLQGHASPEEVEQAEADLAIAAANLISAQEGRRQSELEADRIRVGIERRVIRSPIDGVVLRLHKTAGEAVGNGDAQVATIVQLAALRVTLYLPTAHAARLRPGETVPLRFADSGAPATGRVEFVSPVTNSDSGTVRVVVVIDNPHGQHRSGVRCDLAKTPPDR